MVASAFWAKIRYHMPMLIANLNLCEIFSTQSARFFETIYKLLTWGQDPVCGDTAIAKSRTLHQSCTIGTATKPGH